MVGALRLAHSTKTQTAAVIAADAVLTWRIYLRLLRILEFRSSLQDQRVDLAALDGDVGDFAG